MASSNASDRMALGGGWTIGARWLASVARADCSIWAIRWVKTPSNNAMGSCEKWPEPNTNRSVTRRSVLARRSSLPCEMASSSSLIRLSWALMAPRTACACASVAVSHSRHTADLQPPTPAFLCDNQQQTTKLIHNININLRVVHFHDLRHVRQIGKLLLESIEKTILQIRNRNGTDHLLTQLNPLLPVRRNCVGGFCVPRQSITKRLELLLQAVEALQCNNR